jgi:catechol 2,3-dioxygenase-like lactoylglutathione lyase family enzyme
VFDHVTIRVSDLDAGSRFYRLAFDLLPFDGRLHEGGGFVEWHDFSIAADGPATRRLHVAFSARSRVHVDEWWRGLVDAGYRDDGAPGPRPQYSPTYYGAFVLDPDGNSVEAVHGGNPRDDGGVIGHMWLRVRDVDASHRFYERLAPFARFEVAPNRFGVQLRGGQASFTVVAGEPSENAHLAFPAHDRETVDAFHRALVEAGYRDNGAPGERPQYHPGYYGAYVLDPDGNNVELVFHDRR